MLVHLKLSFSSWYIFSLAKELDNQHIFYLNRTFKYFFNRIYDSFASLKINYAKTLNAIILENQFRSIIYSFNQNTCLF